MRRLCCLLLLTILFQGALQAAPAGEFVIVSGGVSLIKWEKYKNDPHDLWWLNFIRSARIRIQQIRERHGPEALITWLVYSPGYRTRIAQENQDLFGIIRSVEQAYAVRLVFFKRTQELIDHINHGHPRSTTKIIDFEYFGHSNKACFMFDYSNEIDSASKVWLHEDELSRIKRSSFAPNAFVKSWGCHTGESFSQKWHRATGTKMWGAIGKTQYLTHDLPVLSSHNGRWVY